MSERDLYDLSARLNKLAALTKDSSLVNYHAYRYKHFVDSSSLGFDCVYAKKTYMLCLKQEELPRLSWYLLNNYPEYELTREIVNASSECC